MKLAFIAPCNNIHTQRIALALFNRGVELVIYSLESHRGNFQYPNGIKTVFFKKADTFFARDFSNELKHCFSYEHFDAAYMLCPKEYGVAVRRIHFHPLFISLFNSDVFARLKKSTLLCADCVTAPTLSIARRAKYALKGKRPLKLVSTDVDTDYYSPRKEVNISQNLVLGMIEDNDGFHDIESFMRAFKTLDTIVRDYRFEFHIYGGKSSSLLPLVKELRITDKVCFFDTPSPARLLSVLNSFDIFCTSCNSPDKSHDSYILQAMSTALPVVAADNEYHRELIPKKSIGIIVPCSNPDKITDEIIRLVRRADKRADMGLAARRHVTEHYNFNTGMDALFSLLKNSSKHNLQNAYNKSID